jgi:hypothetical protein
MAMSAAPTPATLDFSMLENGLDSLLHAVEHLSGEPTERDLKQGLLNSAGGVELIIKERLARHDWRLLFADPAKANAQDFAAGNFWSVSSKEANERLRDEGVVFFEPATEKTLNLLRKRRNQVIHLTIKAQARAILALAAESLAFALDFIGAELDGDALEGRAAIDLGQLRQASAAFNAFVDERWHKIRGNVEGTLAIVVCVDCGQDAVEIDDGLRCHFCGYRARPQVGAEEFAARVLGASFYDAVKNADYWPISQCPDCGMETLVDEGLNDAAEKPARRWVCFSCAFIWNDDELQTCSSCAALHPDRFGIGMCDDCWDWRVNGSD